MFNVAGITARPDRKEALEIAAKLLTFLENNGLEVFLEQKLAQCINKLDVAVPLEKMKVDLIITVGGGGTILRTCQLIPKPEPPILTINMGVRGFLTEVPPHKAIAAVDKCLEGRFELERCGKLASFIGDNRQPDALNEIFITSRALAETLYTKILRNGEFIAKCQSDGVVIASQVGSTGYSLSGGGPILDPEVDAFILTPICPLTILPPIVFSAKSMISVEILKPKSAQVVIDGYYQTVIEPKQALIKIIKSEYESSFIRFKKNFYCRLERRIFPEEGSFERKRKENSHP